MIPTLTVDFSANAAYLQLGEGKVERTCEVSPGVNVDLDQFGVVVGIEVLTLDALIPYTDIIEGFHVREDQLQALEQIRPNVTSFVTRQLDVDTPPASTGIAVPA